MSSNAAVCSLLKCVQPIARTKNVTCNSGIRKIYTFCNLPNNFQHEGRLFHRSIKDAPDLNVERLLYISSVLYKNTQSSPYQGIVRHFRKESTSLFTSTSATEPLTRIQAQDLILRLTDEERSALLSALQEFQSEKMKAEYEGQLAGVRWRSKFGRPSKLPLLGDVDPTGSFCPFPEDWLARKYAESVPMPSTTDLWKVTFHNGLPFIGFGFLDNFFMILAGDSIETLIGSMIVISTMAAAALGNTISDVLGIGSAWYVERMAIRVGVKPPKLSPMQLDMPITRRFANLGRVLGVVVGCLMGMLPLLFLNMDKKKAKT